MDVPKKKKTEELSYDPVILLLDIYTKKTKTLSQKTIPTSMFIAAFSTTARE